MICGALADVSLLGALVLSSFGLRLGLSTLAETVAPVLLWIVLTFIVFSIVISSVVPFHYRSLFLDRASCDILQQYGEVVSSQVLKCQGNDFEGHSAILKYQCRISDVEKGNGAEVEVEVNELTTVHETHEMKFSETSTPEVLVLPSHPWLSALRDEVEERAASVDPFDSLDPLMQPYIIMFLVLFVSSLFLLIFLTLPKNLYDTLTSFATMFCHGCVIASIFVFFYRHISQRIRPELGLLNRPPFRRANGFSDEETSMHRVTATVRDNFQYCFQKDPSIFEAFESLLAFTAIVSVLPAIALGVPVSWFALASFLYSARTKSILSTESVKVSGDIIYRLINSKRKIVVVFKVSAASLTGHLEVVREADETAYYKAYLEEGSGTVANCIEIDEKRYKRLIEWASHEDLDRVSLQVLRNSTSTMAMLEQNETISHSDIPNLFVSVVGLIALAILPAVWGCYLPLAFSDDASFERYADLFVKVNVVMFFVALSLGEGIARIRFSKRRWDPFSAQTDTEMFKITNDHSVSSATESSCSSDDTEVINLLTHDQSVELMDLARS